MRSAITAISAGRDCFATRIRALASSGWRTMRRALQSRQCATPRLGAFPSTIHWQCAPSTSH